MHQLYFTYPGFHQKALTFTYDDGRVQDRRLVDLFNRHGLKGTFNLTPSRLGQDNFVGVRELDTLYQGHEIASHGYRHLHLNELAPDALRAEVRDGRAALEDLVGRPVRGFASPYGHHNDHVVEAMREAGIVYGRNTIFTNSTKPPIDWMRWAASAYHARHDILGLADRFLADRCWGGTHRLLNIMGHSYEFDRDGNWELIEAFCEKVAGKPDVWYATNIELYDYEQACQSVRVSMDGALVENLSSIPLYARYGDDHGTGNAREVILRPGELIDLEALSRGEDAVLGRRPASPQGSGGAAPDHLASPFTLAAPGWKRKILTFSYDDGPAADRRLVDLFNRHGMKATFNLNTDLMPATRPANAPVGADGYPACSVALDEAASLYKGHEIAVHGARHDTWDVVPYPVVVDDVLRNRLALEKIAGHPVRGMAYPCGESSKGPVADTVLRALGVVYGRLTNAKLKDFSLPGDFLAWNTTAHHSSNGDICELGRAFLDAPATSEPLLCFIWGHSFEFAPAGTWGCIEKFCELMAHNDQIWYATNIEIFEYITAARSLVWSLDRRFVENPTAFPVFGFVDGAPVVIPAGYRGTVPR